jgi:hypothetical protein
MSNSTEFILFIPGIGVREPEEYLEKLINGIRNYCDAKGLPFELDDSFVKGTGKRRIQVTLSTNCNKVIEIQEAYWRDLCPRLSSESGIRQVIRGFSLLFFWITSRKLWKEVWSSKYILFWTVAALVVSLGWYYGVLAAAFTAIGANQEVLGLSLPPEIAKIFEDFGRTMGSWYAWGITSAVISIIPVTTIIDISYGAKCYLENYRGIYRKICDRIDKALQTVVSQSPSNYDRITVVSHSFGVVISTEVLANYTTENALRLRTITLGGALMLFAARSNRVQNALNKVLLNEKIESWIDFYSNNDWSCTPPVPKEKEIKKFKGRQITATVPLDERVSGASHTLYFDDWDVMETLLG